MIEAVVKEEKASTLQHLSKTFYKNGPWRGQRRLEKSPNRYEYLAVLESKKAADIVVYFRGKMSLCL